MVSMVEASSNSTLNNNDPAMESVATKSEPILEGSVSPSVSTPEVEVEALTQDVAQTQKRKGGRKPVRKIFFYSSARLFFFFLTICLLCDFESGAPHSTFCLFFPLFNIYTYHFLEFTTHTLLISPCLFVLCHFFL